MSLSFVKKNQVQINWTIHTETQKFKLSSSLKYLTYKGTKHNIGKYS